MTTPPVDTSTPRKVFPKWTGVYQDFWVDMFDSFCQALISARAHEEQGRAGGGPSAFLLSDDIRIAAELADRAVEEMQYRFVIQQGFPVPTRKKKPRKATRK